jgi:DNA polymerase
MEASVGIYPAMVIGEAPGKSEDTQGVPFVGEAGRLLNRALKEAGIRRDQVTVTNIVKCRPPNNRTPEFSEANTCREYLDEEIAYFSPRHVLVLGNVAGMTLFNRWEGITRERGQWHRWEGITRERGQWHRSIHRLFLPTFHPAYCLRRGKDSDEMKLFFADVMRFGHHVLKEGNDHDNG